MKTLTRIEPFEVPAGQEAEFRKQWLDNVSPLSHAPGLLSTRLYERDEEVEEYLARELDFHWLKERPDSMARFRFINIADWASPGQYVAAQRSPHAGRMISFPSHPAHYRIYGSPGNTFHPDGPDEAGAMQPFTLIAPFEVPQDKEDVLRKQWHEIVEGIGPVEGSIGPGLYEVDAEAEEHLRAILSTRLREGTDSSAAFRFINVAEWASLSHYEAAIRQARQVKPISFPSHPGYYRIAARFSGPGLDHRLDSRRRWEGTGL